jgi:hypothetical protein
VTSPEITNTEGTGLLDQMIAWEEGEISYEGMIALFQALVNSGMAWQLQGMYGRQAAALLESGEITSPFDVVADSADR